MSTILNIAKRELKLIKSTRSRIILLFIVPLIVYFFIPLIYSNQAIHDTPVAVFDEDNTELSRLLTRFLDSSPSLQVVYRAASFSELNDLILNNDVKAAFYFPSGMTKKIKRGKSSNVNIVINSQNIVYGNLIYKAASEIVITVSSGILLKKFGAELMPPEKSMNLVMPFRMHKHPLYNPNYDYMQYLAPGLLTVLFQMILMFAGASAINTEFDEKLSNGGIRELLQMSNNNIFSIITGKTVAYVVASIFPALLILAVVFPSMGISVYGNSILLFFYLLFFAGVSTVMGLMISSILLDKVVGLDIVFFYNSPAFVFSGFTFPAWALPIYDQFYSQLIPYTHFIAGFLQLYQMDVSLEFVLPHIFALLVFMFIGFFGSYVAMKFHIKKLALIPSLAEGV
jgi:ABC-2 type transport system permease protein